MDSFETARKAGLAASIAARIAKGATTREKVTRGVLAGLTDAERSRGRSSGRRRPSSGTGWPRARPREGAVEPSR